MLFKSEHIKPILAGRKTQTRRLWKRPMVKVGGLYWAQTALFKSETRFAQLKVLRLWQEQLGDISETDSKAEGYASKRDYCIAFQEINRHSKTWEEQRMADPLVYCVEFELV